MDTPKASCVSCGSPIRVPADIDHLTCSNCGASLVVQRGEGYVALKLAEEIGQATQGSETQAQPTVQEEAQVTQAELQQLQLSQELSATQMRLVTLQAELRSLVRGTRSRQVDRQIKDLARQEAALIAQIGSLRTVLVPDAEKTQLQLSHELSTAKTILATIQAEIRSLERGKRNRIVDQQIKYLRTYEAELISRIRSLQDILAPTPKGTATQPSAITKPLSGTHVAIIITISIIFVVCVCVFVGSLILPSSLSNNATATARAVARIAPSLTPTNTLRPTSTRTPTYTPTITDTPVPTNTLIPQTATAIARAANATATVQSKNETATARAQSLTATTNAVEQEYVTAVTEIMLSYAEALDGVSRQSYAASEDVSLLLDDEWKLNIAVYLAVLKVNGEKLRKLTPPARFYSVHQDLLEAARYFDRAADLYAQGIDELNIDKIEQASANIELGGEAIQRATKKIEELSGQ